jgi:plasmid stabilization system protein ParE
MSRYVINHLATQDLNQIADYFADDNIEAGEKFFQDFNRKCQQLILFPNSTRLRWIKIGKLETHYQWQNLLRLIFVSSQNTP